MQKTELTEEEILAAFDRWSEGLICTTELREAIGYQWAIKNSKYYWIWRGKRNIATVKNRIEYVAHAGGRKDKEDIHLWRYNINPGTLVSMVTRKDGTVEKYYHQKGKTTE